MRFLKLITLLFLTLAPALAKAQEIEWREDRPLTWKDFNGKPDYNVTAAAATARNIKYSYNVDFRDSVYHITFTLQSVLKHKIHG